MNFKYFAVISGGRGEGTWDKTIEVSGEEMTIAQALAQVEQDIAREAIVVSIEQVDE